MNMKPLQLWKDGAGQNSVPTNTNALRVEVLMAKVISKSTTAQPGSPADGDLYIIPASATGAAWSTFAVGSLAYYRIVDSVGGWYEFVPFSGMMKNVAGTLEEFTTVWTAFTIAAAPSPPNVQSVTSSATVTPTFSNDLVKVTAQAAALTLANPSGTAVDGWGMVVRIKDNGTARAISYGSQYRAADGVTLPTTTVIGKTHYLSMVWNVEDTKMDVLAVGFMP